MQIHFSRSNLDRLAVYRQEDFVRFKTCITGTCRRNPSSLNQCLTQGQETQQLDHFSSVANLVTSQYRSFCPHSACPRVVSRCLLSPTPTRHLLHILLIMRASISASVTLVALAKLASAAQYQTTYNINALPNQSEPGQTGYNNCGSQSSQDCKSWIPFGVRLRLKQQQYSFPFFHRAFSYVPECVRPISCSCQASPRLIPSLFTTLQLCQLC